MKVELKKYRKPYHPEGVWTYEVVVDGTAINETMDKGEAIYLFNRICDGHALNESKITLKSIEL